MRSYLEGHNYKKGYAISREWYDAECATTLPLSMESELKPIRYVSRLDKARAIVLRYNRRFATH